MTSRRRWHLSQRFVSVEIGTAPQARNEGTEIEMAVCREQQWSSPTETLRVGEGISG